jgi:hypothetical protein
VQMMKCRTCGAANSVKRARCFECGGDLHAPGPPVAPTSADGTQQVCKNCVHSTVFPPVGTKMGYSEVWCLRLETVKEADNPAEQCFEPSFTWRREESLD